MGHCADPVKRLASVRLAIAGLIAIATACGRAPDGDVANATVTPPSVPRFELSLARDTAVVLDSADALIARDSSVGLVTVDEANRPRVRSVRAFRLEKPTTARDRFTVFVLTRECTRKIDQIAKKLQADNGAMRSLIYGIVESSPFQKRRGDGPHVASAKPLSTPTK